MGEPDAMGAPEAPGGVAGGEAATAAPTAGLRALLRELEVRPAKGLGQNFLTDRRVVARIADAAELAAGAAVVEADVLARAPETLVPSAGPYALVANLTYSITSAVLRHFLDSPRRQAQL